MAQSHHLFQYRKQSIMQKRADIAFLPVYIAAQWYTSSITNNYSGFMYVRISGLVGDAIGESQVSENSETTKLWENWVKRKEKYIKKKMSLLVWISGYTYTSMWFGWLTTPCSHWEVAKNNNSFSVLINSVALCTQILLFPCTYCHINHFSSSWVHRMP